MDKSQSGYKYGQILTPQVFELASGLLENSRIFFYRESDTITDDNISIEPESTDDIKRGYSIKKDASSSTINKIQSQESRKWAKKTADTKKDSFSICINRITRLYDIPIRNDSIEKISEYMDSLDERWTEKLLPILDNIGFAARVIDLDTIKNRERINTPSIWIDMRGVCSLILDSSNNRVEVFSPFNGNEKIKHKELLAKIGKESKIISIGKGLHAPQNTFNFSWLYPFIKKYKVQLFEIFSASF